jgi:hypothetical protein
MIKHFTSLDELRPSQRRKLVGQQLLAIAIIGEPWLDDHELCCDLSITTALGTVKCSVWWVTWEFLAAVTYADQVLAAMKDVTEKITAAIDVEGQP